MESIEIGDVRQVKCEEYCPLAVYEGRDDKGAHSFRGNYEFERIALDGSEEVAEKVILRGAVIKVWANPETIQDQLISKGTILVTGDSNTREQVLMRQFT